MRPVRVVAVRIVCVVVVRIVCVVVVRIVCVVAVRRVCVVAVRRVWVVRVVPMHRQRDVRVVRVMRVMLMTSITMRASSYTRIKATAAIAHQSTMVFSWQLDGAITTLIQCRLVSGANTDSAVADGVVSC